MDKEIENKRYSENKKWLRDTELLVDLLAREEKVQEGVKYLWNRRNTLLRELEEIEGCLDYISFLKEEINKNTK